MYQDRAKKMLLDGPDWLSYLARYIRSRVANVVADHDSLLTQ